MRRFHVQYVKWIGDIVVPRITDNTYKRTPIEDYLVNIPLPFLGEKVALRWGNFGPSLKNRSSTVTSIFQDNLPISFQLGVAALAVAMAIGIPLGIIAALKRNTVYDYTGMGVAIVGVSVPVIIMGPILQYAFGVQWRLLPVTGWGTVAQMILPAFALGFAQSALLARLTRASLLQVMNEDFIRTARAKGLERTHGRAGSRAEKLADSGRDGAGAAVRRPADRNVRHRNDLRHSRHGALLRHQRDQPRLPGHHGDDFAVCGLSGLDEYVGRYCLCVA